MPDFLGKIKKTLSSALAKKQESILGLDVSSETIKAVQLSRKTGKAVLETYGELSIGSYTGTDAHKVAQLTPEQMAEALKDLLTEAKTTTVNCGVSIPLSSSLINIIQMPDVGNEKLTEMVPIEMRKYIPVNIAEVMLDWHAIPKPDTGRRPENAQEKIDVLVVAIHRDTISRYQEIVKAAGLNASFFEIEVFSTIRAVLEGTTAPAMIIDLGAGTTKIYIAEHRVLRESHIINRGSQDMTVAISRSLGVSEEKARELKHTYGLMADAENKGVADSIRLVLESILAEARRVMNSYQRMHKKNIGSVVISGGGAGLKGLAEETTRFIETQAAVANPFSKVVSPAFLEDVLKEVGPEFAVALGAALRKLEESSR